MSEEWRKPENERNFREGCIREGCMREPCFRVPCGQGGGDEPVPDCGNGLLNRLVAYWPGNEANGDLIDAHTNSLDLTDTATVTTGAGLVYATARQYTDANNEYHTINDNPLLSPGDTDFTIAAWVNLDSIGANRGIMNKYTTALQYEYALYYSTTQTKFLFIVSKLGTSASSTYIAADLPNPPNLATWYLVVAWHDSVANTINIQVNNGTVYSATYHDGPFEGTDPFRIGRYVATSDMNGRIGPTAFWQSAAAGGGCLSAAQRTALYNGGAGVAYTAFTLGTLLTPITYTPGIYLTFDDQYEGVYDNAYPYMAAEGIVGTIYVTSDNIGGVGYMTAGELGAIDTAGWAVSTHGKDHTDLATLTEAQQEANLLACRNVLSGLGFTRGIYHVAYPFGSWDANTLIAMPALGMLSGRLITPAVLTEPVHDEYKLASIYYNDPITLPALEASIAANMAAGDSTIVYMHNVTPAPTPIDILDTAFYDLIDWLVAQGYDTSCRPIDQIVIA